MKYDKEKLAEAERNIEAGLGFFEDHIRRMNKWIYDTKHYVFGHTEVCMTNGISDETKVAVCVLSQEPFVVDKVEDTPHVKLIFDNEAGLDALIKQLEALRPLIRGE